MDFVGNTIIERAFTEYMPGAWDVKPGGRGPYAWALGRGVVAQILI